VRDAVKRALPAEAPYPAGVLRREAAAPAAAAEGGGAAAEGAGE
jgi:hypothetical protein